MYGHFWNRFPIIRALLPFLIGIVLTINLEIYFPLAGVLVIAFIVLSAGLSLLLGFSEKCHFRWRWLMGTSLTLLFFFLGIFITNEKTVIYDQDFYGHALEGKHQALIKTIEEPVEKKNSIKLEVEVLKLMDSNHTVTTSGKAMIYLRKSEKARKIKCGDLLRIDNKLKEVSPPANPNEFNYKKYLAFHNIHYQAFLEPESFEISADNRGNPLIARFLTVRAFLLGALETHISSEKERSVAAALLLGYRDLLDNETIRSYSSTGAMHVLAVSGLHVGIIYVVLNYLLRFLSFSKSANKYFKPVLLILLIWCYAIITGLSPSVVRAATMFSFVTVGSAFSRYTNIYSSIAASAFLLLAVKPFFITEVGFLLSYLAVIGIVYFQPKFYRLFYVPNKWLDKVWAISCVSLAAQIATFPIGVLYFHQFPALFFLSNLIVIPAATLLLGCGLAFFALSALSSINLLHFLGHIKIIAAASLEVLLWILNGLIGQIERIPYSLLQGITITILETYLIYGFILSLTYFIAQKRKFSLALSSALLLIILASFSWRNIKNNRLSYLTIYKANGATAIDVKLGRQTIFLADSALIADDDKMLFHIKHNWWKQGIGSPGIVELNNLNPNNIPLTFLFTDLALTIIEEPADQLDDFPSEVDYVLLRNSPYIDLKELKRSLEFEVLILDSSNNYQSRNFWKKQATQLGIKVHDIAKDGAFIVKL